MLRLRREHLRAADERGAVLVMFALFAPVAVLFVAFVIDASNTWVHARRLQVEADAAALAGAQAFQPCAASAVYQAAGQYGGVSSVSTPGGTVAVTASPLYNLRTDGSIGRIHERVNSQTFYGQPSTSVPSTPDNTITSDPCTAQMLDVKMTETNLPWYVKVFRSVFNGAPYINAQARVSIYEETTQGPGSVPLAVNEENPVAAEAYFINEATGTQIGSGVALSQQGTSNGLSQWSSVAHPFSLTVPTAANSDVGVRIAVSGKSNLTGTMSTDCAATSVLCYDAGSSTAQLLDVHGYTTSGTGTMSAPIARSVILTPATCGDQYYTAASAGCTDGITATIDFGASPSFNGVQVKANGSSLSCTTAHPSVCTGTIAVAAAAGRQQVDITVKKGSSVNVTLSNVQSSYAAAVNGNAGPIQALGLYANVGGTPTGDISSLQEGTTTPVWVQMGITPTLQVAQSVNDPVVVMRLDNTGSQNQTVACTPISTPQGITNPLAAALATGCAGNYQINQPLTCPDPTDPLNNPIDCVSPQTGNATNQPPKGLNYRILGSTSPSTCTSPNHWSSFPNLPANDPRIVDVFVTPYGSFAGSGSNAQFPIAVFATFYITGWQGQGQGFTNPCQGNGDDTAQAGTVVGHFITYINTLNTGGGGGTTCVPNSLNQCIAVLTR